MPPGSSILVEFDPASPWYNASIAIAAGWVRTGGRARYYVCAQPPERIRFILQNLGQDSDKAEASGLLRIMDWYAATLGRKSTEKLARNSLKVADLSIELAKEDRVASPNPDTLIVVDNVSTLARFNEEKAWVEFMLTRWLPSPRADRSRAIDGLLVDVHSKWAYRQLEAAYDGIIDFKIEEEGKTTRHLVRIRSMRDVGFDRAWHELAIGENLETNLVRQAES